MNEKAFILSEYWVQECLLHRKMIQFLYSEDSLRNYASNQGLNGIWNPKSVDSTGKMIAGNSCYMNSTFQCLARTKSFANYFLQNKYFNKDGKEKNVCDSVKAFCDGIYNKTYPSNVAHPQSFFQGRYFNSSEDQQGKLYSYIIYTCSIYYCTDIISLITKTYLYRCR